MDQLIDLYPDGTIRIHSPSKIDPCYESFKLMMRCIHNTQPAANCKKILHTWDICQKKTNKKLAK